MPMLEDPKPLPDPAPSDFSPGPMFVTNTIPDISPNAGVVGLCPVPADRAGMDDLGWHVVDFLAFRALFRGEVVLKAQTWLAQCDIAEIVRSDPGQFAHGKERRLVSVAAEASSATNSKGVQYLREDHIKVEQSVSKLKEEFLKTLSAKAKIAEKNGFPLFIIVCGLTTLEQDIFFGATNSDARLTSIDIRRSIGNNIDVTMITPALFSAGWQINPAFSRRPHWGMRAGRVEFFARQFGAVFASDIIPSFEKWTCPFLDTNQLDEGAKSDRFLGPVMPSEEQRKLSEALKVKLHSTLAGRLSPGHWDHSFDFGDESDNWLTLVGPRVNKPLSYWRKKWELFGADDGYTREEEHLYFLGNAFGGNIRSQVNHIKDLIAESMVACPDYWSSMFGRKAAAQFRKFMIDPSPEHAQCHEMFNIMEHRASSVILADSICDYLALPKPHDERCRDWPERAFKNAAALDVRMDIIHAQGKVTKIIPGVYLPPGINFNHLSVTQRSLEVPATYLAVSLCLGIPAREEVGAIMPRIEDFFTTVKTLQTELLLKNKECEKACVAWLNSINMPTRSLRHALSAIKSATMSSATAEPVNNWPILHDVETRIRMMRTTTPSIGHAVAASPPASAPGGPECRAVHHNDLPTSQSPHAVPVSSPEGKTGSLYDHRRNTPEEVIAAFDRMGIDDVKEMLHDKLANKAQLHKELETASLETLMGIQKELVSLSAAIAYMEAEVRVKEYKKGGAQASEQPVMETSASGTHAKSPAEEQGKPDPVPQKTPKGQMDPFEAWKPVSRSSAKAKREGKATRELERKPDLYTSNPWGQYRHKDHYRDTDDETDGANW
ncbi:hypothetical protein GGR53DRAFT_530126 [Hypoxylon sp. FL1150]|nr:hypothetical protein GGR53DRAFT_530126 [Hypoxylon sp. FL1150]